MNDFIHCNKCFALSGSSGTKFLLTSCSHIFCYSCSISISKDRKCSKCKSSCSIMPLDSSTKPEIKMYFEPLDKLIVKLAKIEKFQRTHRQHLMRHLTAEISNGGQVQEKWERKVCELKKEINVLRSKLNRYDSHKASTSSIGYYSRQNPLMHGSNHHQGALSQHSRSHYNSAFGNLRGGQVTPVNNERMTCLEQRSNRSIGSSKITLRSVSDISGFRTR